MTRTGLLLAASILAAAVGCATEAESGMEGSNLVTDPNAFGNTGGFGGAGGFAGSGGAGGTGFVPVGGTTGSAGMSAAGMFAPPPVAGTGGVAGTVAPVPVGGTGGAGGAGGMGAAGTGSVATSREPVIPAVAGNCPTFTSGTISFMGLSGITIVAGPKPAAATAPMVFYWHGTGSTAGEFNGMATAVRDGVVAEGGVLVSFQGTTGGDLLSGTNIFGAGDFDITDQLVACAVRDHNVDPHRIFATGCSAGGLFSTAMAAHRSSYMAAAAPNSGGFVFPQPFQTDYTPPLMTIHGENDMVIVDFRTTSATADMTFADRGGFVINCNHGGGHCGGGALAPQIWEFFKAHPYGVEPEPWNALPSSFPSYCEIY
jgi:hypothetical protein